MTPQLQRGGGQSALVNRLRRAIVRVADHFQLTPEARRAAWDAAMGIDGMPSEHALGIYESIARSLR